MILPVMLRRVASGLMMEKVRSSAMIAILVVENY
jgi:hypothetical protein